VTHWSVEGLASHLDGFRLGPVDLELPAGRVTAVLGNSGAGKTTLLRTIAGFLPVDAGRVVRDRADVTDRPPEDRGLGYVPQGLGLFPHRTVERNVSYSLEVRGRTDALVRSREWLERFGLTALADRRPARLSGGEAERVALARALAAEPELLLWDEPWQALDVEARFELGRVFVDLRATAPVPLVVVTHDPGLAFSIADSFLVLRRGKVAFLGDAATLLARPFDAFTARFVGYENVFDRASLDAGPAGSLAAWLAERAGPDGVAFPRPTAATVAPSLGAWEGIVHGAHPTPEGVTLSVRADALPLVLRYAAVPGRTLPATGDRVRFDVDEKSVRPLGGTYAPALPGPGA
jgi:ABC-type sulfate/molybdate transport systems ATPase subunit